MYIRDPADSGIFLLIDQSDQPRPDPLADWRQQAASRQSSYPGYHLILLQAVQYTQAEKAADWEFTYDKNGVMIRVLNRNILANAQHAYALYWSTPASDWNADYHFFQVFADTFRPAPADLARHPGAPHTPWRTLATQDANGCRVSGLGDGLTVRRDNGSDPGSPDDDRVTDIPVAAGSVRWERPTARSFWNALADPEREALAATGVEEFFRAGAMLCRVGEDTSHVMIIDSGWVKVSVREGSTEKIVAVRGQGDVVGERAALSAVVRSATVTALDEVSAMVIPAERFAEFLRRHPRAAEVLERQVAERREEDRGRLFPASQGGAGRAGAERDAAERRLAWLLSDLAQRRGGHQHGVFTLPMSQQELADWAGTSADAVGRFLRSWRDRGLVARGERSRRLTVIDLDRLAALSDTAPDDTAPDYAAPDYAAPDYRRLTTRRLTTQCPATPRPAHTMPPAARPGRPPNGSAAPRTQPTGSVPGTTR